MLAMVLKLLIMPRFVFDVHLIALLEVVHQWLVQMRVAVVVLREKLLIRVLNRQVVWIVVLHRNAGAANVVL